MAIAASVLTAAGFSYPAIGLSNGYAGPLVLAVLVIWLYAAYWAFDIRKALSAPLFRNQALGMGLVAIGWLSFNAVFSIPVAGTAAAIQSDIAVPILLIAVLLTFYWTDASILAAERTDPLSRDTLRWSVVRKIVWVLFVVLIVVSTIISITQALGAPLNPVLKEIENNYRVVDLLLFVVAAVMGVTFVVSVSRSKDRTIKRHLRWFGLAVLSFFGVLLILPFVGPALGLNANSATTAAQVLSFTLFSYFVYRSAKSLAPLERLGGTNRGNEPRPGPSGTLLDPV